MGSILFSGNGNKNINIFNIYHEIAHLLLGCNEPVSVDSITYDMPIQEISVLFEVRNAYIFIKRHRSDSLEYKILFEF